MSCCCLAKRINLDFYQDNEQDYDESLEINVASHNAGPHTVQLAGRKSREFEALIWYPPTCAKTPSYNSSIRMHGSSTVVR